MRDGPEIILGTPRWEAAPFDLSYRVGEITLFRKQFRGLALREHFFNLGNDPGVPNPPFERFGSGIDVIITRSHPVSEALPAFSMQDGVLRYVIARYSRYHTDLSGSFDDYLAKFSSKSRNTLRRKVRRLVEHADGVVMKEYRRPEEMENFLKDARTVSARTYQEKLLDAGIPGDAAYLADLRALAAKDRVRGYLLRLGGVPIAYLSCPAVDGVLMYGYLGYDPKYADLSPGTVLQYLAFESIFGERRFRAFDFTEGQGVHKRFFGTHETACADICYFPDRATSRFWIALHRGFDHGSIAAAALLEKAGLKSRLKRFLRRL